APLCFRQHCRRLRTEVVRKRLERVLCHFLREHNAVVVSGNGKNWGGIVAVGIVELIEVIHLLAEVVNHVSEMKQKRRPPRIVIFARDIGGERVCDGELMRRLLDAARVAKRMEHNAARTLNLLYGSRSQNLVERK